MSQHIKKLEAKVGFSLVTRQGKISFNPGGRNRQLGKNYVKCFDDVITEIQQESKKLVGRFAGTYLYRKVLDYSSNGRVALIFLISNKSRNGLLHRLLGRFEARDLIA